jgi:hypothetical protein
MLALSYLLVLSCLLFLLDKHTISYKHRSLGRWNNLSGALNVQNGGIYIRLDDASIGIVHSYQDNRRTRSCYVVVTGQDSTFRHLPGWTGISVSSPRCPANHGIGDINWTGGLP